MFAKAGRYRTLEELDPEGGGSGSEPPGSAAQHKSVEMTGDRAAPWEAQRGLGQCPAEDVAAPLGSTGPTA